MPRPCCLSPRGRNPWGEQRPLFSPVKLGDPKRGSADPDRALRREGDFSYQFCLSHIVSIHLGRRLSLVCNHSCVFLLSLAPPISPPLRS